MKPSLGGCMISVQSAVARRLRVSLHPGQIYNSKLRRHRCGGKIVGQVIYELGDTQDTQWVCQKHVQGDPARVIASDRALFQPLGGV